MLFGAELACRWFIPHFTPTRGERALWSYDPLLGWSHRPNQEAIHRHQDFAVQISINSQGLRDREYSLARDPQKRRVLVLGDSYGWGFGVEQDEVFSEIVESRHENWEVINASVSGYGTDQEYLFLEHSGMKYRPDLVLVLLCVNDLENILHLEQYWHNKPRFRLVGDDLILENVPVPGLSFKQRMGKLIVGRTYFFGGLYRAWKQGQLARNSEADPGRGRIDPALGEIEKSERFLLYLRLMGEMKTLTDESGVPLVVVSTPTDENFRQALEEHLPSMGIPFMSLNDAFEAASQPTYFAHDPHWNPYGHQLAAVAIDSFLAGWSNGLVGR